MRVFCYGGPLDGEYREHTGPGPSFDVAERVRMTLPSERVPRALRRHTYAIHRLVDDRRNTLFLAADPRLNLLDIVDGLCIGYAEEARRTREALAKRPL